MSLLDYTLSMEYVFPTSGVETSLWLPPLAAFIISFFTSMVGVSGAFLLLPFQMSVLGFVSPAVSPTNLVFNIVAIPGGVYRYMREGRMVWRLTWIVVAGSAPGVILGGFIRLLYLPDPEPFKVFAGCVLLYVGLRLVLDIRRRHFSGRGNGDPIPDRIAKTVETGRRRIVFEFRGIRYQCSTTGIFCLSLLVGVVGGVYGIGGGAIIAPFFVAIFGLPVQLVAGATLMGTFVTSIVGVAFYQLIAPFYEGSGMAVAPDWLLGSLFGVGGLAGTYLGARTQRFVPTLWLKLMLAFILLFVAVRYLTAWW